MADQQQHGLHAFALHQPQVTHCGHRGPVGAQERHRTQDGSQSYVPAERDSESEKTLSSLAGAAMATTQCAVNMPTHQKE